MRYAARLAGLAFVGASGGFACEPLPMPTPVQLADAIGKKTGRAMAPADLRPLKCEGSAEEPTEFECRWAQRINGKWLRFRTYFVVERDGWTVLDWPPGTLK